MTNSKLIQSAIFIDGEPFLNDTRICFVFSLSFICLYLIYFIYCFSMNGPSICYLPLKTQNNKKINNKFNT